MFRARKGINVLRNLGSLYPNDSAITMIKDRSAMKTPSPTENNQSTRKTPPIQSITAEVQSYSDSCDEIKGINIEQGSADEGIVTIKKDAKMNTKARLKSRLGGIVSYLKEYCDSSGLHGIRYLSEENRNGVEKLFWFFALTLCAVGCSLMIVQAKEKLDTTPVIVTIAESATNIWHLPFPAVTICPLTKSRQRIFNFTKFANKIYHNESIYDDYILWVENIIAIMSRTMSESADEQDFRNESVTWKNVASEIRYYTYGDDLSEELMLLLTAIYTSMKNSSELLNNVNILPLNWAKRMLTEWTKNEDFHNSLDEYYLTWHREVYQKLRALQPFCKPFLGYWDSIFGKNKSSFATIDESALEFIIKVSPGEAENIHPLDLNYDVIEHNNCFKRMWTTEGLCYTYNMMNNKQIYTDEVLNPKMFPDPSESSNDWHPDTGYSPNSGRDTFPRRPLGVGREAGFFIYTAEQNEDLDYLCQWGTTGYRIILHRPEDHPQPHLNYVVDVPFRKYAFISINPSVMKTSPGLVKYDAQKRQCYYASENHLEYFKFYSKNNCELECLTKATLKMCGCVAFYMPRNMSTKMCGIASRECVSKAAKSIETREFDGDIKEQFKNQLGSLDTAITKTQCDCLPSCVSITYEADVTMVDFNNKFFEVMKEVQLGKEHPVSVIEIFYKNKHFIATRRSELYGRMDFLASIGGLLGLFCGFSLVSLIEFIYFLTLRLASNLYQSWTAARKVHRVSSADK